MKVQTFQEWSDAGYTIIKGSKSQFRNSENIPLFTEQQVRPYRKPLKDWNSPKKAEEVKPPPPTKPPAKESKPYAGKLATAPPKVDMESFKNDPLIREALADFSRRINNPEPDPPTPNRPTTSTRRRFSADPVFEDSDSGGTAPCWLD